ncbi:MAG: hypothetical protein OXT09_03900, partial [Myxococcales bacterium]|nr:hypothetical protein [Myxococcales bacterium]
CDPRPSTGEPPWKAEDRKGPPTRCDARAPYPIATMHWVPARPLLSLPWSLVVFGTVLSQSSDGSTEPGMKVHRVRADEVLLDRTAECAGAGDERDRCRGYCGESELSLEQAPLPSGSRIVIFGLAGGGLTSVLPFAIDETSRTSVQVAGPEDPFVDAVRVLVNTDNPRMAMASQRPVWTRFGEHDVDCFVHQIEWQQCTEVDMGELATRRCGAGSPADLWSA